MASGRMIAGAMLALALVLGVAPALARESCPFVRDPAFFSRHAVAPADPGELAVGTLNLYRLFDDEQDGGERDVLSPGEFRARVARIARYVVRDMGAPVVLGVQEAEDETALRALATAIGGETGRQWQYVVGKTSGDSDIRSGLLLDARVRVLRTTSLFARTPREGKPLHDRLPLVVEVDARAVSPSLPVLTLVVVHMKSMRGLGKGDDDARVRAKRRFQADELAAWARAQLARGRALVLLGDFNAIGGDAGDPRAEPLERLLSGSGLATPAARFLKPSQRWTYRFHCSLNELDHLFTGPAIDARVSGYAIARGDTCLRARERCSDRHSVSDHEGVVLQLR